MKIEFLKSLIGKEFHLRLKEGTLSSTAKYYLTVALCDPQMKAEVTKVKRMSEIYEEKTVRFFADKVVMESTYTGLGRKIIDLIDGELNGKQTRTLFPVQEEDKIIVKNDDGFPYAELFFNESGNAFKLCDAFAEESYFCGDEADFVYSVPDILNVQKGALWVKEVSGAGEKWKDCYGTRLKDVRYGDKERELLDIYLPENLDTKKENGILISVHGGGWIAGDKSDEEEVCTYFTKKGYITASIGYTLISLEKGDTMSAIFEELKKAVSKIKALSDENGWNITKAAFAGGSAGGHLSLMYAYKLQYESLLPVKFVAALSAPVDLRINAWKGLASTDEKGYLIYATAAIGKDFTAEEAQIGKHDGELLDVSPVNYTNAAVPTLLAYGIHDGIQNPQNGRVLSALLSTQNVKHEYVEFPHCNHLMACDAPCHRKYKALIEEYLKEYFGY